MVDPPTGQRALNRFLSQGADANADREVSQQRVVLLALVGLLALVAVVRVGAYGMLVHSGIPGYAAVEAIALLTALVYVGYAPHRRGYLYVALALTLLYPASLHLAQGGFAASGCVLILGLTAPMGALLVFGAGAAWPWLAAYLLLLVGAGALEWGHLLPAPTVATGGLVTGLFLANLCSFSIITYAVMSFVIAQEIELLRENEKANERLQVEENISDAILRSMLPDTIAAELKRGPGTIAQSHAEVAVLFADIAGFTQLADGLNPHDLIALLDGLFTAFDHIVERRGLEKIKTVGDAYIAVAGMTSPDPNPALQIAELALELRDESHRHHSADGMPLRMHIGVDRGPVVAGILGTHRYAYDVWGDTVNTASRMASTGVPDAIQVTAAIHDALADRYAFEARGPIAVKGKGEMSTYLLLGPK